MVVTADVIEARLTVALTPDPHPHPIQVGELARDAIGDEAFDKLVEVDRYRYTP